MRWSLSSMRLVDDAHPALAELREDTVVRDRAADEARAAEYSGHLIGGWAGGGVVTCHVRIASSFSIPKSLRRSRARTAATEPGTSSAAWSFASAVAGIGHCVRVARPRNPLASVLRTGTMSTGLHPLAAGNRPCGRFRSGTARGSAKARGQPSPACPLTACGTREFEETESPTRQRPPIALLRTTVRSRRIPQHLLSVTYRQ